MKVKCKFKGLLIMAVVITFFGLGNATYAQPDDREPGDKMSSPAEQAGRQEEGIRLNFRGASLDSVLEYLSRAAGFVIISEAEIEGRIDVWSHQPLSRDEAVNLLNTILKEKGYTAIRNERTLTIVKQDEAKKRNIPVRAGADPSRIESNDEMVTQIIPVRYADAVRLIDNLTPLLPSYATLTANESSNALVLTDTQSNIRRMVEIIQALDTSISTISVMRVFPLDYSDATELAEVINDLFEEQLSGTSSDSRRSRVARFFARMRGGPPMPGDESSSSSSGENVARQAASRVIAVADERTNSLVVSAPDELMVTIEELVKQVDTVAEDITEVRVFHLEYADAEEMADIVKDVFEEDSSSDDQQQTRRSFRRGPFGPPMPGGQQQSSSRRTLQETQVLAVADTRTNSVVISAAKETLSQIAQMIVQLDENPAKDKKVYVYSLKNADVENVAEILKGMFEESSSQSSVTATSSNRLGRSISAETSSGNNSTSRR